MHRSRRAWPTAPHRVVGSTVLLLATAACGGGGAGGATGGGGTPPTSLAYSAPTATFETNAEIAPELATTTGGAPDLFVVAPALPAGLTLDAATGTISGTPTTPTPEGAYLVSASNVDGAAHATLHLTVVASTADSLAAKASFTDDDIRHFLART